MLRLSQSKFYHMKTIVVTGTDTEVGKTYVSCLLIHKLREIGMSVGAWKPVCSGAVHNAVGESSWEDVEALANAVGGNVSRDFICPQRFQAVVAPNVAAEMEGRRVDENLIRRGPVEWESLADVVVIEGAGGLLSPISDSLNTADLAEQNDAPVILVAANRLGVINHTLLTAEVLRARGLEIAAIVLNDVSSSSSDESRRSNLSQLTRLLPGVPLLFNAYGATEILGSDGHVDALDGVLSRFRETSQ